MPPNRATWCRHSRVCRGGRWRTEARHFGRSPGRTRAVMPRAPRTSSIKCTDGIGQVPASLVIDMKPATKPDHARASSIYDDAANHRAGTVDDGVLEARARVEAARAPRQSSS